MAVPIGNILSNGKVLLKDGVETPGVMWESPSWRLMDNGVIFYKNVSGDGVSKVVKGVQYFGSVNEDNVFSLFPQNDQFPVTLDQIRQLNIRNVSRSGRTSPPLLQVPDDPVLVKVTDLELLQQRLLKKEARKLVMIIVPPAGPPVTIALGYLLPGGQVSLDRGVEVEGSYWENMDRVIYNNGTIVYKGTEVVEEGEVLFGTVGDQGTINLLPELDNVTLNMNVLRSLNINVPVQITQ